MTQETSKSNNVIEVQAVYKSFGDFHIHCGVDLKIKKGKITYIMGGSGTGKSLLLKEIMGFIRPDKGSIIINGQGIHDADRVRIKKIRQGMGILFQNCALFDSMSVFDNVAFPLREQLRLSKEEIKKQVNELLSSVGLSLRESVKAPADLSGGQKKRVAFARAIALKPSIIMYDEPTTGLDPITVTMVLNLIKDMNKNYNLTSIVISHDTNAVFDIAEELALLKDGVVCFSGEPKSIFKEQSAGVQEFFAREKRRKGL